MCYSYDRRQTRQAARPIPVDKNQARKLVERAVKSLSKYLRPKDPTAPLKDAVAASWRVSLGDYTTTDVRGKPVKVEVRLGITKGARSGPRQWISGGTVQAVHTSKKDYGEAFRLLIGLNHDRSAEAILGHLPDVSQEMYSVLIHEFTHLRDLIPYQERGDYHNRPTEVRAFMQQVADEVLSEIRADAEDDGGWLFSGYGPSSGFVDGYVSRSPTWKRVQTFLTPQNQKLILRGVTRAIQDEWSELQKAYPEEDFGDDWDPSKEPLPLP